MRLKGVLMTILVTLWALTLPFPVFATAPVYTATESTDWYLDLGADATTDGFLFQSPVGTAKGLASYKSDGSPYCLVGGGDLGYGVFGVAGMNGRWWKFTLNSGASFNDISFKVNGVNKTLADFGGLSKNMPVQLVKITVPNPYPGGLLTALPQANVTTKTANISAYYRANDNDMATSTTFINDSKYGAGDLQFKLTTPAAIRSIYVNYTGANKGFQLHLYNSANVLLHTSYLDGVDTVSGVRKDITPVNNVDHVELINTVLGTVNMIVFEADIYTDVTPPIKVPKDVSLVTGHNDINTRVGVVNYNEAMKLDQSLILPYEYRKAVK